MLSGTLLQTLVLFFVIWKTDWSAEVKKDLQIIRFHHQMYCLYCLVSLGGEVDIERKLNMNKRLMFHGLLTLQASQAAARVRLWGGQEAEKAQT